LRVDIRCRLGKFSMLSTASVRNAMRRFRRNRRGSAAVEFALVAPVFFALLFAIIETAMVFFAGQVLETGVQDSGRLIYTSQNVSQVQFKQDFCNRVGALFPCDSLDLCLDVRRYAPGTVITLNDPVDSGGNYVPNCIWQDPLPNYTMVVRAFYPWPLFVTGLGYNIANLKSSGSAIGNSRLLAATAAFRPQ
jgi:Flp pilus assembly pilin Flp